MMNADEGDSLPQDDANCSTSSVQETVSLNRSCLVRKTIQSTDVGIQTDICCADRPKLRVNKKKATEEIKSTCATVSAVCGVSVEI